MFFAFDGWRRQTKRQRAEMFTVVNWQMVVEGSGLAFQIKGQEIQK